RTASPTRSPGSTGSCSTSRRSRPAPSSGSSLTRWSQWKLESCSGGEQFRQQPLDATLDVVADGAHRVDVLTGWVVELPVFVALARKDGAGVAAAHGDDD